jgi:type 2 lantibiotic biosynthesis protein LanM
MVAPLVEPALADLAARLAAVPDLSAVERSAVATGAAATVRKVVWAGVSRAVLLELHAARLAGTLRGDDPAARWRDWVDRLARPGSWQALAEHYPELPRRVSVVVAHRCRAALAAARRFGRDRPALTALLGAAPGELRTVDFGAGDSHRGGQTVTIMRTDAGPLVYKPRPVEADRVLAGLLAELLPEPDSHRIRVPTTLPRQDGSGAYGWAEYVAHRYCSGETELVTFYRNLGHWLAVMRLLGGSDLHAENVIASGPVPVVVDSETLFAPHRADHSSGYGGAVDLAADRIGQSVLRTGLLPGRGALLGWRGVDPSAAGFLPGQQPAVRVPVIEGPGSDRARMGTAAAMPASHANHPSPTPELGRYWEHVVDGFTELTDQVRARDDAGELAPLLEPFADCTVRVLVRDTATYATLARMLWHPTSLHRPAQARDRARELLVRQARRAPLAPADPAVVDAELAELADGDIPVFLTTPRSGELVGPGGVRFGAPEDLIRTALWRFRRTDPATDRQVVRAALVAAYLNDGDTVEPARPQASGTVRSGDLERRRRAQVALVVRRLWDTAVCADDGTATWIAPTRDPNGWAVRPSPPDLYNGGVGVAVLLAAYLREVDAGRAEPVAGLADLLGGVLRTQRLTDEQQHADRTEAVEAGIRPRPETPGGYLGLGSRIWGWLLLHRLGAVDAVEAVDRAERLAAQVPSSVVVDDTYDLLAGMAGAVVPLLRLGEWSGRYRWTELAGEIGRRLRAAAQWSDEGAWWAGRSFPDGVGGLSHGVTGVGWALARLAAVTDDADLRGVAEAAFAWEEARYDPRQGAWQDVRSPGEQRFPAAWCHGAVGIGVAAADLMARGHAGQADVLGRAAHHTRLAGFGLNHTLCHGVVSAWEVLERAGAAGAGRSDADGEAVVAQILTSFEDNGPVAGFSVDVVPPGLFPGLGGIGYQLLRMHPDSGLPSVLLPDPGPPPAGGVDDV